MTKTIYVLGVVLDPATGFAIGLTKTKGPSFLHGKLTFPGGKLEGNESPQEAMAREIAEETGVEVPASAWILFETREEEDYVLHKLAALSPDVLKARQLEQEPVWHLAIERHVEYARQTPEKYAPDFLKTLLRAQEVTAPACA